MEYSEDIMSIARQQLKLEPDDTSSDAEIKAMPRVEVLEMCLDWEGIVGFSQVILGYINSIYHVNLEPTLEQAEQS